MRPQRNTLDELGSWLVSQLFSMDRALESPDVNDCICEDCADNMHADADQRSHRYCNRAQRKHHRPRRNVTEQSVVYTVRNNRTKFQIDLNARHFSPEDINVQAMNGFVIIKGKHNEKKHEPNCVSGLSRRFKQSFALPGDCDIKTIEFRHSCNGMLSIRACKQGFYPKHSNKDEGTIRITPSGPVRRKEPDEDEGVEEGKSPQKKPRC